MVSPIHYRRKERIYIVHEDITICERRRAQFYNIATLRSIIKECEKWGKIRTDNYLPVVIIQCILRSQSSGVLCFTKLHAGEAQSSGTLPPTTQGSSSFGGTFRVLYVGQHGGDNIHGQSTELNILAPCTLHLAPCTLHLAPCTLVCSLHTYPGTQSVCPVRSFVLSKTWERAKSGEVRVPRCTPERMSCPPASCHHRG